MRNTLSAKYLSHWYSNYLSPEKDNCMNTLWSGWKDVQNTDISMLQIWMYLLVNPFIPAETLMCQWTRWRLVRAGEGLFGGELLPALMLLYLPPNFKTELKWNENKNMFIKENADRNGICNIPSKLIVDSKQESNSYNLEIAMSNRYFWRYWSGLLCSIWQMDVNADKRAMGKGYCHIGYICAVGHIPAISWSTMGPSTTWITTHSNIIVLH